jgi:TRAP-type C4-dicarboxylate transport system substrate-binding protein
VNPAWYNNLPDNLKAVFDASAEAALIYSDTIWLNSETGFFNFLSNKLKVNAIKPEDRPGFVEKTKSVWKSYIDQGYFTQKDIDQALDIAKK